MSFAFPTLAAAGLALAVGPLLLHLLRRRRRRVNWAAIEFLMESQRRRRRWLRLSEWLLLASRIAVVVLAGAAAATPRFADRFGEWFAGGGATHYVLLDDTASMQAAAGDGGAAWDAAREALDRLVRRAARRGDSVRVVRYTDALAGREPVQSVVAGETGTGPADPGGWSATHAVVDARLATAALLTESEGDATTGGRYAWVLSDFGASTHDPRGEWVEDLRRLADRLDGVALGVAGASPGPNLAIDTLSLAPGPHAAGVETRLRVGVTNHSDEPTGYVSVAIRRNGAELTGLRVGPIDARGRVEVDAPIALPAGEVAIVEAELPADASPADDRRQMAIAVPDARRVLLVDDRGRSNESRVFAKALRPRDAVGTGWGPRIVELVSEDTLADAAAVILVDAVRLSVAATERLREHVARGGAALLVLGPRVDAEWFNRSLAGSGPSALVPWRLGPAESAPAASPGAAMLRVADSPAMRVFAGERGGFLPLLRVDVRRRLIDTGVEAVTRVSNGSADDGPDYDTLATFADGAPLIVESRFGDGVVVALLTTASAPDDAPAAWSNLATLPVFPVLVNDLVAWATRNTLAPLDEPIGRAPAVAAATTLQRWDPERGFVVEGGWPAAAPASPSVYRRVVGEAESRPFAAVVDPAESDLRGVPVATLQERLGDAAQVAPVETLLVDEPGVADRLASHAVLLALALALVCERTLASLASHVQGAAAPKTGGAR